MIDTTSLTTSLTPNQRRLYDWLLAEAARRQQTPERVLAGLAPTGQAAAQLCTTWELSPAQLRTVRRAVAGLPVPRRDTRAVLRDVTAAQQAANQLLISATVRRLFRAPDDDPEVVVAELRVLYGEHGYGWGDDEEDDNWVGPAPRAGRHVGGAR